MSRDRDFTDTLTPDEHRTVQLHAEACRLLDKLFEAVEKETRAVRQPRARA